VIPDPAPPFDVEIVGSARVDLQMLLKRATRLGMFQELRHCLLDVQEALRADPRAWGDPIRNLRPFQAVFYRRMYYPLIVHY
jgi:hypothetical protein